MSIEGPAAVATISSLPDAVLHYCFFFHLLVQVIIDMFLDVVRKRGALLPFRASPNLLCFRDERRQRWNFSIREIAFAASRRGRVSILEWAYSKGLDFDAKAVLDHDYIVSKISKPALCLMAGEKQRSRSRTRIMDGIQESGHGCRLSYDSFL
jgi:hypothetical protein